MSTDKQTIKCCGCELTKDKPSLTWTFEEEDDDSDYLVHTLFLKHGVLGTSAVKAERNVVQIETKNFDKKEVKLPFLSLTLGQSDMCNLDLSFSHDVAVTFRLIEGAGPVCLSGQHLVEFPPEEMFTADESALEEDLSEEEEDSSPKKGQKRKAGKQPAAKSKKGKTDESMSSADDSVEDEEDEEDEEGEDEEDEEEEESMEDDEEEKKPKKGKKVEAKKGKKSLKTTKASPKRAAVKKGAAKKGKK